MVGNKYAQKIKYNMDFAYTELFVGWYLAPSEQIGLDQYSLCKWAKKNRRSDFSYARWETKYTQTIK